MAVTKMEILHTLLSVPQLERCSYEGKICFWGSQNFWAGLLFSDFSVDLQQKNCHRANLVYFAPSSMLISR